MSSKVLSTVAMIVGGLGSIFELLDAFGVSVSAGQQQAIASVAGLALLIVGAWFNTSVPVGVKK